MTNKLESHEKLYKRKDFCGIALLTQKDNILEFNQYINEIKCNILSRKKLY